MSDTGPGRFVRKTALLCLAMTCVAGLCIVALFGFWMWASRTTPYCPWRHEIHDLASCAVLDADGERVLIQHAELDINVYYLEIRHGEDSRYFRMPESITQLAPQGYRAELVPDSDSEILLNGEKHRLEELKSEPKW